MSSEDYRVVVRKGSTLRTEVMANGYTLVADEPIGMGGTNSGPTPYDYLLSALGACTAMTVRMYADHKKWPLESVAVRLRHQKVYRREPLFRQFQNSRSRKLQRREAGLPSVA